MMRVLHVIPYVSSIYGGPPAAVAQMAKISSALGMEVDVATTTASGRRELQIAGGQPIAANGANYFHFPRQTPRSWMFSRSLHSWLYQHVGGYDVIHVHGLFTYTTFAACSAARYFGKPYLISLHGMLDPWCLSHKWWKKMPYYYLLERRNLQGACTLHATSDFEASGIARLGLRAKTHVVPLAVEQGGVFGARTYEDHATLSLLFLARLDPIKGLPILLRALPLVLNRSRRSVLLKIAGLGENSYRVELHSLVQQLGLSENVEFLGFLHGEAKARALAEADIFVLPSYHENFSLATAEAMAAGLPVIVTDQVGLADEIANAAAGAVIPTDSPELLADAIEELASAERRRVAGENGRRLVQKKFSEIKVSKSLLGLYEAAMNARCDGTFWKM